VARKQPTSKATNKKRVDITDAPAVEEEVFSPAQLRALKEEGREFLPYLKTYFIPERIEQGRKDGPRQ
jgi:hypothetical protein